MRFSIRIGYVAAREGHMAEFLCCIQKNLHTPAPAVIAQVHLNFVSVIVNRL